MIFVLMRRSISLFEAVLSSYAARTAPARRISLRRCRCSRRDAAYDERSLRNAIAWGPNWFKPHWMLAQFLELANRRDEALREAEAAVERDGGHDPEGSDTLKKLKRKGNASP